MKTKELLYQLLSGQIKILSALRDLKPADPTHVHQVTFGGVEQIRTAVQQFPPFDEWAKTIGVPPTNQQWTPAPGKSGPAWCYPNPALTPGKASPDVTQATIATTIAVPGWTATVRPAVNITNAIKLHIMQRDDLPGKPSDYELDHWWPIECGGAYCDLDNFWCMPYLPFPGAREKDRVENWLKSQIVSGAMTLDQAHTIINDDWYACYLSLNKMGLLPMMAESDYDPSGSIDGEDS